MNFFKLFFIVGMLSINYYSVAQHTPSVPEKEKDWTVLIYMNGDNNLEPFAIANFLDMAKVGSTDRVNIIVQFDRINKYDTSFGNWTQTLRFKIERDMKPSEKYKLEDLGEADMGKGKVLEDFVSWGIKKFPAKHFLLDIWDHGQGYRLYQYNQIANAGNFALGDVEGGSEYLKFINKKFDKIMPEESSMPVEVGNDFRSSVGSPYKSCSNDETDSSELYNREIQDALSIIVKSYGKKLDIIGFDCCLMAMVETAFAFRNVSNYMVGSEDLEPGAGWKYDDWLGKLKANPGMEADKLSKLLVSSYQKTYQQEDPSTTLSAINLSKMDEVATAISDFSTVLMKVLKEQQVNIKKARTGCANYAPSYKYPNPFYHIDFIRFCTLIASQTTDTELKSKATLLVQKMRSLIIFNYCGESRRGNYGTYGLAIYFPPNGTAYAMDKYSKNGYERDSKKLHVEFPVEFVEKHKWTDFLHDYYKIFTN